MISYIPNFSKTSFSPKKLYEDVPPLLLVPPLLMAVTPPAVAGVDAAPPPPTWAGCHALAHLIALD